MHRIIYVAVPNTFTEVNDELLQIVRKEICAYNENLDDTSDHWEESTALYELITPDHPEAKSHIDYDKMKTSPIEALRDAFVSMEEERVDRAYDRRYRAATGGIAIFDAREYVRIDRDGKATTNKLQIDWDATRIKHGGRLNYNSGDFIYHYAASIPKYVLKALHVADISEICFMDSKGNIAIGRSILHKAKWDWWVVGGRWSDTFKELGGEYGDLSHGLSIEQLAAGPTANWTPEIITVVKDELTTVHELLSKQDGWDDMVRHITEGGSNFPRDVGAKLEQVITEYKSSRDEDEVTSNDDAGWDEKWGKDVNFTVKYLLRNYLRPEYLVHGVDKVIEFIHVKHTMPTALVIDGKWEEYENYACGYKWYNIPKYLETFERFKEDLNYIGYNQQLVAVDIHQ